MTRRSGGQGLTLYDYAILYDIQHGSFDKAREQVLEGRKPSKPYAATHIFFDGKRHWGAEARGLEAVVRSFIQEGWVVKKGQTYVITPDGGRVLVDASRLISTLQGRYLQPPPPDISR